MPGQFPRSLLKRGRAEITILARRGYASQTEKLTPNLKYTAVTHPDSASPQSTHDLLASQSPYLLNTYSRPPILFTHGRGSTLYAASTTSPLSSTSTIPASELPTDRAYLDFTAGIAVNALGHADPQIVEIMRDQSEKIMHLCNVYWNEYAGELARSLIENTKTHGGLGLSPGSTSGGKVFFSNSGTEANEGALKFARKHGKETAPPGVDKSHIVCFANAFHGRSLGALSVTPNPKYQDPFAPLLPNIRVGELNVAEGLEELIDESVCGIIVEPIQGEGGVNEAQVEWLEKVGRRAKEVGAVLIYDEIQCGLFRTGNMWAHSKLPAIAQPDIVTMAKPLANGFPIGAIMVADKVADVVTVGSHGTTFGGQVLATRLGAHVVARLSDPAFLSSMSLVATHLDTLLSRLPILFPTLIPTPIRGRGLIRGIPFAHPDAPSELVKRARERGLLLLTAGKDAVRCVPSLIVTKEECEFAVGVMEGCLVGMVEDGWGEK